MIVIFGSERERERERCKRERENHARKGCEIDRPWWVVVKKSKRLLVNVTYSHDMYEYI